MYTRYKLRSQHRQERQKTPALFVLFIVTLTFRPFDPQINGFQGLMVKHLCVKFGDRSSIVFRDVVRNNRQTNVNRQTNKRR